MPENWFPDAEIQVTRVIVKESDNLLVRGAGCFIENWQRKTVQIHIFQYFYWKILYNLHDNHRKKGTVKQSNNVRYLEIVWWESVRRVRCWKISPDPVRRRNKTSSPIKPINQSTGAANEMTGRRFPNVIPLRQWIRYSSAPTETSATRTPFYNQTYRWFFPVEAMEERNFQWKE